MQLTRRGFCLSLALGAGAGACVGLSGLKVRCRPQLVPHSEAQTALGTKVEITAFHETESQAAEAVSAAFVELELVEEVMSLYRSHSQLCRLNREGLLHEPHPYLVEVLEVAQELSARSGGKFDVTVQPLWRLHDTAAREGRAPSPQEIAATVQLVDWQKLTVSPRLVQLHRPGMAVTLNGIAQGFAADRAKDALRRHGVEHALINTGELASLGQKPNGAPWRVGIQHPRQDFAFIALADLDGRCLATSGDYATAFGPDGKRHHLLDPDRGDSAIEFVSVSIAAPNGMLADGLSTAVFVLGPQEGMRLVRRQREADLLGVLQNGRMIGTPGFPRSREEEAGA